MRVLFFCMNMLFCATLYGQDRLQDIGNFHPVDSLFFRSAQPKKKDFSHFDDAGITTVINLRRYWKDNKRAKHSRATLFHIPVKTSRMSEEDLVRVFTIIKHSKGKVLVHCWHGSDRTGAVAAVYSILYQNKSKEEAINEMINGGYGYHKMFNNLPELIRSMDIAAFRRKISAAAKR